MNQSLELTGREEPMYSSVNFRKPSYIGRYAKIFGAVIVELLFRHSLDAQAGSEINTTKTVNQHVSKTACDSVQYVPLMPEEYRRALQEEVPDIAPRIFKPPNEIEQYEEEFKRNAPKFSLTLTERDVGNDAWTLFQYLIVHHKGSLQIPIGPHTFTLTAMDKGFTVYGHKTIDTLSSSEITVILHAIFAGNMKSAGQFNNKEYHGLMNCSVDKIDPTDFVQQTNSLHASAKNQATEEYLARLKNIAERKSDVNDWVFVDIDGYSFFIQMPFGLELKSDGHDRPIRAGDSDWILDKVRDQMRQTDEIKKQQNIQQDVEKPLKIEEQLKKQKKGAGGGKQLRKIKLDVQPKESVKPKDTAQPADVKKDIMPVYELNEEMRTIIEEKRELQEREKELTQKKEEAESTLQALELDERKDELQELQGEVDSRIAKLKEKYGIQDITYRDGGGSLLDINKRLIELEDILDHLPIIKRWILKGWSIYFFEKCDPSPSELCKTHKLARRIVFNPKEPISTWGVVL